MVTRHLLLRQTKDKAIIMQCPNGCATLMEPKKEERIFHRNNQPVVISDLTIYVCPRCDQESMPLSSAKIVESILRGDVKPSGKFTAELYVGRGS